jgi:lysophospholipase L1-like esterase
MRTRVALVIVVALMAARCHEPPITRPTPQPDPLAVSCPSDVSVEARTDQNSVVITYPSPTTRGGVLPIQTTCTPVSGGSFSIGTTQVTCRASDALSSATCSFAVVVRPPPQPPRLLLTDFVAFGDSLTEGKVSLALAPWVLVESSSAYTLKLEGLLKQRYSQQNIRVINEGLGGEKAKDGIKRLEQALDQDRPGVLLLMDGANDLFNDREAGIQQAVDALDAMITRAKLRNVRVLLASLPPQIPDRVRSPGQPYVVPLNDRIKTLAGARDVTFVDVYAAFNNGASLDTLVGSDGLHLTDAGYELVARAFYDRIVATLEVKPPTSARR